MRTSRILVNKASGDNVLQVLGNKARKNCQIVPVLPMYRVLVPVSAEGSFKTLQNAFKNPSRTFTEGVKTDDTLGFQGLKDQFEGVVNKEGIPTCHGKHARCKVRACKNAPADFQNTPTLQERERHIKCKISSLNFVKEFRRFLG